MTVKFMNTKDYCLHCGNKLKESGTKFCCDKCKLEYEKQ